MEMQRMLDGSIVPVGIHRDDLVECSDGTVIRRVDAEYVDCKDVVHSCEDDKDDANDDIVREMLDAEYEWCMDYVASDDYGNGYAYLVREAHHNWAGQIGCWLDEHCVSGSGYSARPLYSGKVRDALIESIGQRIYDLDCYEGSYNSNEYAAYYGSGCCLDSFGGGEYETQVDIKGRPEFEALHESGDLEGCIGRYNGDLCINENDRYDRESGRRVKTGYVSKGDHPHFYGYAGGVGVWHYAVDADQMGELVCEAIADYCRRADG